MKNKNTRGIYLHIPFCVRKCHYCDFLSAPADEHTKGQYVNALIREIKEAPAWLKEQGSQTFVFSTAFFGGGTPSILKAEEIVRILTAIRENFGFTADAEITMEVNPGTLTEEKARIWHEAGVNRISFGLQSADDEELKRIGRIHTFAKFQESFRIAREAGFDNINVDLMSALPGQSMESYEETVRKVLEMKPEHISSYSLILEEGTYLYDHLKEFPELPDEDMERAMYHRTCEMLKQAGFIHYEISNFSLPGRECRHNQSYWDRTEYLGVGLGSATLIGNKRFTGISSLKEYLKADKDDFRECQETLDTKDEMSEYMFLGLRMMKGVSLRAFEDLFGMSVMEVFSESVDKHIKDGTLKLSEGSLSLTERGIDVANFVMSDFLVD